MNIARKLGFRAESQPDPDLDLDMHCSDGLPEVCPRWRRRSRRSEGRRRPELEEADRSGAASAVGPCGCAAAGAMAGDEGPGAEERGDRRARGGGRRGPTVARPGIRAAGGRDRRAKGGGTRWAWRTRCGPARAGGDVGTRPATWQNEVGRRWRADVVRPRPDTSGG